MKLTSETSYPSVMPWRLLWNKTFVGLETPEYRDVFGRLYQTPQPGHSVGVLHQGVPMECPTKPRLFADLGRSQEDSTGCSQRSMVPTLLQSTHPSSRFEEVHHHHTHTSLNLLLDDALRTKLADFGWTRTLSNYMTGKIGTYQWMAPEVIAG